MNEQVEKIKEKLNELGYSKNQVDVLEQNPSYPLLVRPPYDFVIILRPL
jgi:hypothetical protein